MTDINRLSKTNAVAAGDLFPLWKTSGGQTMAAAASTLLAYMQANLTIGGFGAYTTQYSAPSETGFSVTITDGSDDNTNVHLILTPGAAYAAGTIVLPPVAGLVDKQEVLVNCTQDVTTLTVSANGATAVTGEPSGLSANDFFRLKYDAPTSTWYRVG